MKKENPETVRNFGEKRLIKEIIRPACAPQKIDVGIGDDAAVVSMPQGSKLLVSSDKIPEDLLAIQLGLMDAASHGRYLATVNISDIAAMGGEPMGLTVTLGLPNDFPVDYLKQFYHGLVAGCGEWDISVIGGDTGWASAASFSASAVGHVRPEEVLTRSTAKVGDSIFVTGPVGVFGTALAYFIVAKPAGFRVSEEEESFLKKKLVHPVAQVTKGRRLARSGICTSCMDITDGLASSLFELASCSEIGFSLDRSLLPIHSTTLSVAEFLDISPLDIVFGVGLDLELLGTLACRANSIPTELLDDLHIVGTAIEERVITIETEDGKEIPVPDVGWQHFSGAAIDMVRDNLKRD